MGIQCSMNMNTHEKKYQGNHDELLTTVYPIAVSTINNKTTKWIIKEPNMHKKNRTKLYQYYL